MDVSKAQCMLGDLAAAKAAATLGLDYADPDRKLVCNRYLLTCSLYAGDPATALQLREGQDPAMVPGALQMAEYFVLFKDDRATAEKLVAEAEKNSPAKLPARFPRQGVEVMR
jgi:hypothetical protein